MLEIFYPSSFKSHHLFGIKSIKLDEDDYWLYQMYNWYPIKGGYLRGRESSNKMMLFHKEIMDVDDKTWIDHKNRNSTDNRKENLRIANRSLNCANRKKFTGTSKYKGVCWDGCSWRAQIKVKQKQKYLGVYRTEEKAARVYDKAAKEAFGLFANLNFKD